MDWRGVLLALLAGFFLAFALMVLAGRNGLSSPNQTGHAPADNAAAAVPEPFDYFPSSYVNEAREIEPHPETF